MLLTTFSSELEISQKALVDFCKLASLLESPGFLRKNFSYLALRLELL